MQAVFNTQATSHNYILFLQFVCNQGNHSMVKTITLLLQWD